MTDPLNRNQELFATIAKDLVAANIRGLSSRERHSDISYSTIIRDATMSAKKIMDEAKKYE